MKKTTTSLMTKLLVLVLSAVMVLSLFGCTPKETDQGGKTPSGTEQPQIEEKGEGQTSFTFKVTFKDETERAYKINTDKETVGEALVEVGLISGSEGAYGLMVDTVDGETLDYNTDGMYWAFYVNGEYAMTGVDSTPIDADTVYSFVASEG